MLNRWRVQAVVGVLILILAPATAFAQRVTGTVRDQTGGVLPGVTVEAHGPAGAARETATDAAGTYRLDLSPGRYELIFSLVNFAPVRRAIEVVASSPRSVDVVLRFVAQRRRDRHGQADVHESRRRRHRRPRTSSGSRSPQARGRSRRGSSTPGRSCGRGEVLETVPGVVISQHSGEGKANQYYLRGFNLDHGTDFAHDGRRHAGEHADARPRAGLLGPQFPDSGAGQRRAVREGPVLRRSGRFRDRGFGEHQLRQRARRADRARRRRRRRIRARALAAASPKVGSGQLLGAVEVEHNDGPWERPDDYRKVNGVVRYSRGDAVNGFSITGMGYRATWDSTDQVPQRAIDDGLIGRFGAIDNTDGGDTYRYSGSLEWQRSRGNDASTKVDGVRHRLRPQPVLRTSRTSSTIRCTAISFTRRITGSSPAAGSAIGASGTGSVARCRTRSACSSGTTTSRTSGCTTPRRASCSTRSGRTAVMETSAAALRAERDAVGAVAAHARRAPRRRLSLRRRCERSRERRHARTPASSARRAASSFGPFNGTEFYVNAGFGFHSNDARGTTITRDPATGEAVDPRDAAGARQGRGGRRADGRRAAPPDAA